jgi:hypothetical protein
MLTPCMKNDGPSILSLASSGRTLGDYISQCRKNGGAVTINLGICQDGSVDPGAVDVLKEVRQRIRKEQQ